METARWYEELGRSDVAIGLCMELLGLSSVRGTPRPNGKQPNRYVPPSPELIMQAANYTSFGMDMPHTQRDNKYLYLGRIDDLVS
jgi:hypothetical protein